MKEIIGLLIEIHRLQKENNALLRAIYQKISEGEANDFSTNVIANLIANVIDKR